MTDTNIDEGYIGSYPEKIYLQADEDEPEYAPHETTWCEHEQGGFDVAYIREDKAISALAEVKGLREEVEKLRVAIETDRAKLAIGIQKMDGVIAGREWMIEGRGPYEWDDENYQKEFQSACSDIHASMKSLRQISNDWTNCSNDDEIITFARAKARQALKDK